MGAALAVLAEKIRHPGNWLVVSMLLGFVGLPAPVVAAIGAALDLAPRVIDLVAVFGTAAATIALRDPAARPGAASGSNEAR